jgi:enoyl-CoA hydratase
MRCARAGRVIDAKEALAIGLVNEVVPSGQCLKRALELARFICQLPQPAIRADKVSRTALPSAVTQSRGLIRLS